MNGNFSLHDEREQNKIGLETYFLDKRNMFDVGIDNLILDLKSEISKSQAEFENWNKLQETDPGRYAELAEQAERYEISLDIQQYETLVDIAYREEQLLSLVEMKIIYAFKFLEINVKKLLSAAFSLKSSKDLYRWDNLIRFLEDKNVDAKSFKSYFEMTQIKRVNNSIKHSEDYESSLKEIPEFRNSDKLTYAKLDLFYNRIKEVPNIFLQELIGAIYKELYQFDDAKINTLAESLILRMGKDDAMKLAEKINTGYR